MTDILLDGQQMKKLLGYDSKVISYPELYRYKTIDDLFKNGINKIAILYIQEETDDSQKGHWCIITKYPTKNKVCFYDSYGLMPDSQLKWLSKEENQELNQGSNYLTKLLYNYAKSGNRVEYNEMKFQKRDKNIATCGRHCAIRGMHYMMPLKHFQRLFNDLRKSGYDLDDISVIMTNKFL